MGLGEEAVTGYLFKRVVSLKKPYCRGLRKELCVKKRKEGNLNQKLEVWVVKEGNRAVVKKRKAKLEFD